MGYIIPRSIDNQKRIRVKQGTKIKVKVKDLQSNSTKKVVVKCDYCGKKIKKEWRKYIKQREGMQKDSCKECSKEKQKEMSLLKYGVENCTQRKDVAEKLSASQRKHTIEDVRDLFKKSGYILLTTKYINNEQDLYYICPKHGIHHITLGHFKEGKRCKDCFYEFNSGENNNRWNGGITSIEHYLRTYLYNWRMKSLKKYNYSCFVTGIKGELEIHHVYSFYNIVQDVFNNLNLKVKKAIGEYTIEELELIKKEFLRIQNKHLGVPLIPEIHKLYHAEYGVKKDTPENFKEFTKRFDNHEFDNILNIIFK